MHVDEDITEDTTAINWDCHDGTDRSRITIRGIAETPPPLAGETRALRRRRKLREQLVREHIENVDPPSSSLFARIVKKLFGSA